MERAHVNVQVMENWQNWKTGKIKFLLAESPMMILNRFSVFHEVFSCRREKYSMLFSFLQIFTLLLHKTSKL